MTFAHVGLDLLHLDRVVQNSFPGVEFFLPERQKRIFLKLPLKVDLVLGLGREDRFRGAIF